MDNTRPDLEYIQSQPAKSQQATNHKEPVYIFIPLRLSHTHSNTNAHTSTTVNPMKTAEK